MAPDRIDQRHQSCRGGAHPVRQRRYVEVDAFALVDVALTVEWQVQAILGEQDMGQQPGSRAPTRNRVRGGRRLADRFAGSADELLTDVLDHFPLARDELQRLGHILAELAQSVVAAAWASRRHWIHKTLPRQMLRQRPARRFAPLERGHRNLLGCGHLRGGLGLRGVLLEIGELQLKLVQQCAALGGLSELLVPQLLDREFELLDEQGPRVGLGFCGQPGRALGAQHRLQGGHIVGERIIGAHRRPENHKTPALSGLPIVPAIQIPAISRPPAAARCVAASANRCPQAGGQAGLG